MYKSEHSSSTDQLKKNRFFYSDLNFQVNVKFTFDCCLSATNWIVLSSAWFKLIFFCCSFRSITSFSSFYVIVQTIWHELRHTIKTGINPAINSLSRTNENECIGLWFQGKNRIDLFARLSKFKKIIIIVHSLKWPCLSSRATHYSDTANVFLNNCRDSWSFALF